MAKADIDGLAQEVVAAAQKEIEGLIKLARANALKEVAAYFIKEGMPYSAQLVLTIADRELPHG